MLCFECRQTGKDAEAIAICHHCSAALCAIHCRAVVEPVVAAYPVSATVELPVRARVIFCDICFAALHQKQELLEVKAV